MRRPQKCQMEGGVHPESTFSYLQTVRRPRQEIISLPLRLPLGNDPALLKVHDSQKQLETSRLLRSICV